MGQITRAYNTNGTLRFDALAEMKRAYPKELAEWSWSNVYDRPDLQLRGLVLKLRGDYRYFLPYSRDPVQALKFTDAAYNGGRGGVDRERRACKLSPWCDPAVWDGNVQKLCMKSKAPIYAGRSACDINRHHVHDVFDVRSGKYKDKIK
jgi:hypothetical protein